MNTGTIVTQLPDFYHFKNTFNTEILPFTLLWNYFCIYFGNQHNCLKRFLKISGYILLTLLALLLALVAAINYSPVQSIIVSKAASMLSDKLETRVEVDHVRIGLLNSLLVQGVYIEDKAKDTLLYAGEIEIRITDWFIFKDKPVLKYVGLHNTFIHLYRTDTSKVWNYGFIADAFSSPKKKNKKPYQPVEFDLKKLELENVRIYMDDRWVGEDLDVDIGYLLVNGDAIDVKKKLIDIDNIEIKKGGIYIHEYTGGRPQHLKPKHIDTFDTSPFNPDMWQVRLNNLKMADCFFKLKANDKTPVSGLFDENHLDIKNISATVSDVGIIGDTVRGDIQHLSATERCGLALKKMQCKATVSPIAAVCEALYLETNNSKLKDYYAMHYKHFPNFLNYIDSVEMVANLKESEIDKRDIQFFAPELDILPDMLIKASGKGKGTVSNLLVENLRLADGHIALRGNLTMKGLPDIYTTLITFTDAEILTTGKGILHYAPSLRQLPNFALDSISKVYFVGVYEGYIENFRVQGTFASNTGKLTSDVKMYIPGFNSDSATYSGQISTEQLQLGKLVRQPLLGNITLNEKISGFSFNPDFMQMQVEGSIKEFGVKGYNYHNILTQGTLARKQFDGKVLVDDPNLALDFDGSLNYEDRLMKINAEAHLLGSNFKAMNITKDNITASADFDLNWTGSNIDNFSGYAKLFNIDLHRNARLLAIDSVYLRSSGDSMHRNLSVNSDAFTANINGNYRLSSLPASVQYYLSRYIPNYIKAPEKYAPDQQLNFEITTSKIDSIFAVTVPMLRGFDNATVSGSLNTRVKKLALSADIPYGSIGNVHLRKMSISGDGDLNALALNTTVSNIAIGDSVMNGALSLTTSVGNDSVLFSLATISPDKGSSISMNGRITAYSDTLELSVFPSQFFMNKVKWNIAGGSQVVYSDNFLFVKGVSLTSDLQRLSVNTRAGKGQPIVVNIENIDVAQLGHLATLNEYEPDGRINGVIKVEDIFNDLVVNANVRATDVKLGNDTIGTINITGEYSASRNEIRIDPQTGIYRDNASIVAFGTFDMDSTSNNKIDGSVRFNDARVAWAGPFLTGLMSNLAGTVNGSIDIWGSPNKPVIDGKLSLKNAALRFDYLGCKYVVPKATVSITNTRINLGEVIVYDSYNNTATLSGHFSHELFEKMRMRLKITTPKFEVMNLTHKDNDLFYGKLVASMDSFTIRGPFNNIRLNLFNGTPAAKSTIYIPASTGGYVGAYSYVSFVTYGSDQEKNVKKRQDKISINLDANLNTLAEIHIVLDPATEDEIVTTGTGNIQIDIPPDNDMRMSGIYNIYNGTYTLTFQQLLIQRVFRLNAGSTISFNGPFSETNLAVDAVYSVKARMYDLLTENDRLLIRGPELIDAQSPQWVNVMLHMNGPIYNSKLTFDLDLDNNHSQGTLAYRKLQLINNDDRQKFDQVASLLLVGAFIIPETSLGASALSGTVNNISQIISSTASTGLTNIVNKLLGNRNLNVAVKYTNYNYNDQATVGNVNRNQLKLGLTKNYLNNRLLVSVGSTSDWGRPASSSNTTNFNIAGDFRFQYVLSEHSGLRLNAFQTSDYDLTRDQNILRRGVGISWRRSFDNLGEFFRGSKYVQKQKVLQEQEMELPSRDSLNKYVE